MTESDLDDESAIGRAARGLIRRARKAALATLGGAHDPAAQGWPANALVTVAAGVDGCPILLLSTLAHHTRNLLADARASLLIEATEGFANPQAGPRVTAMGRIVASDDPDHARRFVARHPAARAYAGFGDFAFYCMEVERLHSVGGFARARWVRRDAVVLPADACAEIGAHEDDILAHLNGDHSDTLVLYARAFFKSRAKKVHAIAVDPDGVDLRAARSFHRVDFAAPAKNLNEIRKAFVDLAQRARKLS